ncbi:MAG: glycosyltransferase [Mycobacterium kyogaense]|uniref:glycosyltransferase n=1 Tax=Mycobacterium kyogaense TaxID=2212479 RepID=UPI002FF9DBCB
MKVVVAADAGSGRAPASYDAQSLAGALSRRDHDVRLVTASPADVAATGDYRIIRMPVTEAEPGAPMPMISEMGSFLVDEYAGEPPDVVLSHGWVYGMAAALAANRRPVATVQAFAGVSDRDRASETAVRIETLLARNASMVTALCSDDMHKIVRLGAPRSRVGMLPCGIDVDAFTAAPAQRGGARHRIVALVDDLAAPRGVGHLIAALPAVPSAELFVLGAGAPDGEAMHQVLAHARRSGVGARTHVLSADGDTDVAAWLGSADVAVLPSPYDPDPRLALTAMACGAAVVAVDTGGPRDAVVADVTGLLVPPGHPRALSRALRSVLAQNVLREGMGLAGRARARSRYSWDRIAVDAELIFQAVTRRDAVFA